MNQIDSIGAGGISAITNGLGAAQSARISQEMNKFQGLIEAVQSNMDNSDENKTTLASSQVNTSGRLSGDYTSGFAGTFTSAADRTALPSGAAANSGSHTAQTIDKTSKLYEKSLELESYFVKIMLSSMRNSVTKTSLNGKENSYAQKMYEDMLYDELATVMTKNAGFGLADQIYMQLV